MSTFAPSARTRVAGVIGDPIQHSLSPAIHNEAFRVHGDDWVYVAFPVSAANAVAAIGAMRAFGVSGLSVTMPHKELVVSALDHVDASARAIGAVNTIVRDGDSLIGYNTDGVGCLDALHRAQARLGSVAVIGAGATARAIIAELARVEVKVGVLNRSVQRGKAAVALGNRIRPGSTEAISPRQLSEVDVIINATPLGMRGVAEGEMPLDPDLVSEHHTVLDAVYHPLTTALLEHAAARGANVVDGLDMLCAQAARQQELWLGRLPDVSLMRRAALNELENLQR